MNNNAHLENIKLAYDEGVKAGRAAHYGDQTQVTLNRNWIYRFADINSHNILERSEILLAWERGYKDESNSYQLPTYYR